MSADIESFLVSVVVVTYNSEKYILETLNSIRLQSYSNIELIISDDCSVDNTVDICCKWLEENSARFVNADMVPSVKNKGTSAACNIGLRKARGEWIKYCAGDDTLKQECISDNILWLMNNPESKVLFSGVDLYRDNFEDKNFIRTIPDDPFCSDGVFAYGRDSSSQYRRLLVSDKIHFTPSSFLNREVLNSVGGFDERFKILEDYPLWLNITKSGHKLYFMNKSTVNYRQHSGAINNTGLSYLINPNYFKQEYFRRSYTYKNLPVDIRFNQRFIWLVSQIFRPRKLNKNTPVCRFFYILFTVVLNPFRYYLWLKKRLFPKVKENGFYL